MNRTSIARTTRPLALALAALIVAPLLTPSAASAAVRRVRVIRCAGGDPCWPAAFAFTPNGRKIFYGERFSGRIRVRNLRNGNDHVWHRIKGLSAAGETGLLGLALDPRWPEKRFVYAYFTKANPFQNRIARFRKKGGGDVGVKRLMTLGANGNHNGGVIHFGPDNKLYAVTGDLGDPAKAQRKRHPAGKILRMTRTGKRPGTNPFARSKAWSYGHRNSFGFTFDPRTGRLWQTENGPACNDEVNRVRKGRNYGWGPNQSCPNTNVDGSNPVPPAWTFSDPPALTGAAFCQQCKLGARTNGTLLIGAWNDRRIRRARLDADRKEIVGMTSIFTNPSGVLAVEAAPNGRVFFSDSSGIYRLRR